MDQMKTRNYKAVIIGDSSVGKSSLMLRFTDDHFSMNYLTTIGVDFKFSSFMLNQISFKIQIWDTAGQEKYQTITKTFYKGTDMVILVFDLTSRKSFEDLSEIWLPEVEMICGDSVMKAIVGNKSDLSDERKVEDSEALAFARDRDCLYFETSCKNGNNVERVFFELTEQVYEREEDRKNEYDPSGSVKNLDNRERESKIDKCC